MTLTPQDKFKPQYHVSPDYGWMNDIQRPIILPDGSHHLYYLYNKDYPENGTEWAHVSTFDFMKWTKHPVAMEKYKDASGDPWTGSCVIDKDNTAGFGYGAIIALVTMPNPNYQCTHFWVSTDNGEHFFQPDINPIMPNPTGHSDFRDPKIFWYEPDHKWVMLLAEGSKVGFYYSHNLREWTYMSGFSDNRIGIIECPDLFELNIDGNPSNKKWVLMVGGNGFNYNETTGSCYFVGRFDGITFTAENEVVWLDHGSDSYAGVTWDAPYTNGNFRYYCSWMSNWEYATSVPWDTFVGHMSVVSTISLQTTSDGVRLVRHYVNELNQYAHETNFFGPQCIHAGDNNILDGIHKTAYKIEANFILDYDTIGKFGFSLREGNGQHTDFSFDPSINEIVFNRSSSGVIPNSEFNRVRPMKIHPENHIKLEILVDRSSIEIFVNDGHYVLSNIIFPELSSDGMRVWVDNKVKLDYMKVFDIEKTI